MTTTMITRVGTAITTGTATITVLGGHTHAPKSFGRAFAIGMALNAAYVLAEVFYGIAAHSLALLADAGHNLAGC